MPWESSKAARDLFNYCFSQVRYSDMLRWPIFLARCSSTSMEWLRNASRYQFLSRLRDRLASVNNNQRFLGALVIDQIQCFSLFCLSWSFGIRLWLSGQWYFYVASFAPGVHDTVTEKKSCCTRIANGCRPIMMIFYAKLSRRGRLVNPAVDVV
jgi:hypothetical protein